MHVCSWALLSYGFAVSCEISEPRGAEHVCCLSVNLLSQSLAFLANPHGSWTSLPTLPFPTPLFLYHFFCGPVLPVWGPHEARVLFLFSLPEL